MRLARQTRPTSRSTPHIYHATPYQYPLLVAASVVAAAMV